MRSTAYLMMQTIRMTEMRSTAAAAPPMIPPIFSSSDIPINAIEVPKFGNQYHKDCLLILKSFAR